MPICWCIARSIAGHNFGAGALPPTEPRAFAETGEHMSMTERRAAAAERSASDRYPAAFLAERVGASFAARINGVTRAGLFVTLNETGADGLVPIRSLPGDFTTMTRALTAWSGAAPAAASPSAIRSPCGSPRPMR